MGWGGQGVHGCLDENHLVGSGGCGGVVVSMYDNECEESTILLCVELL